MFVDPSLHFSIHCQKVANKTSKLVGLIRRSFSYLDGPMMTQLFKAIVRPHLEYANVVWSPQYAKDSTLLENVQRRATKLIPGLSNLQYEERLRSLKLPSLVYRRKRGDLIEVYKYKNNLYKIDSASLLPPKPYTKTRGHAQKIEKKKIPTGLQKKSSFQLGLPTSGMCSQRKRWKPHLSMSLRAD